MSHEFRFAITAFFSGLSFFALGLVIPLLSKEMNYSLTENSWLLGIFSIAVILFSPVWGTLSDRLQKRKPFLVVGTLVFAACSIAQFFAQSFSELLMLRFVQGAAFATNSMLTALFSDTFGARAASGFGFFSAASALGFAIGSLLGGFCAEGFGIRSAFLLSGGMAFVVVLVIQLWLPDSPPAVKPSSKAPLPAGLSYLYLTIFVRQAAAMALWSIFPIYLLTFVENKAIIGAIGSSNMIVQPFFMIWMGRMAERLDHLKMVMWGIVASVFTFLVFAVANDLWLIVLGQMMIAVAWSIMFIGLNMYLMERSNENNRGRAFGYLQASFTTAMAAGPFLGGPLSDAYGMHTMIFVVAGLMMLSLPFLWRLRLLEKTNRPCPSGTISTPPSSSSAAAQEISSAAGK